MNVQRMIPDNPLEFIRKCIGDKKILWTYHVNMRLEKRSVTREMIMASIDEMIIIEEYVEDKYFPSYLLLAYYGDICYHVGTLKNCLFAQYLRYAQNLILGISAICLWLNFSHALILNENPNFSRYPCVLIAVDLAGDNVRVVTAYLPNPDKWGTDYKTRRKSK